MASSRISWRRPGSLSSENDDITDNTMTTTLDNNNKRRDFRVDDFDMMKTIGTGG